MTIQGEAFLGLCFAFACSTAVIGGTFFQFDVGCRENRRLIGNSEIFARGGLGWRSGFSRRFRWGRLGNLGWYDFTRLLLSQDFGSLGFGQISIGLWLSGLLVLKGKVRGLVGRVFGGLGVGLDELIAVKVFRKQRNGFPRERSGWRRGLRSGAVCRECRGDRGFAYCQKNKQGDDDAEGKRTRCG